MEATPKEFDAVRNARNPGLMALAIALSRETAKLPASVMASQVLTEREDANGRATK